MAVVTDTSALVEVERGHIRLEELAPGEELATTVITLSELLHGLHRARGARQVQRRAFIEYFLGEIEPLPITELVARLHADLWSRLVRRGQMIGAHDLWISATALAHGAGVVTTDVRDFSRVPGLRVVGLTG